MARSILVIAERAEATMTDQLEIEQKFEADEDFGRPDFGGLPGVTAAAPVVYHLAATYFDTQDQRLMANKITLRRRVGGTDEGWHLKLPTADGNREELHEPLGDSTDEVPARLASQVAEVTGGRPLAPIAQLDTERTVVTLTRDDGRAVAEVADDLVTARRLDEGARQPLRWREIEVEVPDPEPELQQAAADLLQAAGARPAGYASKLGRLLSS
jgi:inorganic triphosphatase YgiF